MRHPLYVFLLALSVLPSLYGCGAVVVTGAATGAIMADDRRTSATFIMDQEIALKAGHRVSDQHLKDVHVNCVSFNRRVLVVGQAPSQAVIDQVTDIVRTVPNVRDVDNEMSIGAPTSLATRSNDAYISTKVKARFVDHGKFDANHVKVVTEDGVVYLLGLVTRKEGDAAAALTASTSGVSRVVKDFEYID